MRRHLGSLVVVAAAMLLAGFACHHVGKDALLWEPDGGGDSDTDADSDSDTGAAFDCEGSGVWLDEESGLCWQDPPDDTLKTWQDAFDDCDGLELAGYDDWRMPNIDELRSLVRGCPVVETDGDCQVHDGSGNDDYDDICKGCLDAELEGPGQAGCYWDPGLSGSCLPRSWSSSQNSNNEHWVWIMMFKKAQIAGNVWDEGAEVTTRCVRDVE